MSFEYDVVIPTHGRAQALLRETLESVNGQSLPPHRVIVVVDGDRAAADALAGMEPRVTVICLSVPGGAAAARQAGIEEATAEWVCFVDDDDLWRRDKMAVTAAYIHKRPECGAVRAPYYVFTDTKHLTAFAGQAVDFVADDLEALERVAEGADPRNDFRYLDIEGDSLALLLERNRSVIGTTCVRREFLQELSPVPPRTRPGNDHLLACLIATRTELCLISEPLMFYRLHAQQSTRTAGAGATRNIIRSRALAWQLCGPFSRLDLVAYGGAYRREFRSAIWLLVREKHLVPSHIHRSDLGRCAEPLGENLIGHPAVVVVSQGVKRRGAIAGE